MTKWIFALLLLIGSLVLNVLQYMGSPSLDWIHTTVEKSTGLVSSQSRLKNEIDRQRVAHAEAVSAVRKMAARRIARIAGRAPAEVASGFLGQISIPVTTSLVAWDLYDLCVISSELEGLEANFKGVQTPASLCGYEVSMTELLAMLDVEELSAVGSLVDTEELLKSEAWENLREYSESVAEEWQSFESYLNEISDLF